MYSITSILTIGIVAIVTLLFFRFMVYATIYYFLLGIRWLSKHQLWFPKTTHGLVQEEIVKLSDINNRLDRYILEMEKKSSGVFRKARI